MYYLTFGSGSFCFPSLCKHWYFASFYFFFAFFFFCCCWILCHEMLATASTWRRSRCTEYLVFWLPAEAAWAAVTDLATGLQTARRPLQSIFQNNQRYQGIFSISGHNWPPLRASLVEKTVPWGVTYAGCEVSLVLTLSPVLTSAVKHSNVFGRHMRCRDRVVTSSLPLPGSSRSRGIMGTGHPSCFKSRKLRWCVFLPGRV